MCRGPVSFVVYASGLNDLKAGKCCHQGCARKLKVRRLGNNFILWPMVIGNVMQSTFHQRNLTEANLRLGTQHKGTLTWLRSGDRRILPFPLRHNGHVHTYVEQTRADLPFVDDKGGLEHTVSKQMHKIGCWTHLLQSGFCFHSASVYVWKHVMICVEANFPPASTPPLLHVRSMYVSTYLNIKHFMWWYKTPWCLCVTLMLLNI